MIAKTGSRFGRWGTEALIDLESPPSRPPSGSTACWSALSSRPEGRRQLDPPERATLVHWPLRAHEAGSVPAEDPDGGDRKSTRLNSSHANISYAVFCLK